MPAPHLSRLPNLPLNVVVIYDDDAAGIRAAQILAQLRTEHAPVQTHPWCVEALTQVAARCRALADVVRSDLLLLALSRSHAISPTANRWLSTCLELKCETGGRLLAFIDSDELWTIDLHPTSTKNTKPPPARSAPARREFGRDDLVEPTASLFTHPLPAAP